MTNAVEGQPRAGAWTRSKRSDAAGGDDRGSERDGPGAGRRGVMLLLPLMLGACGMFSGGGAPSQKEATQLGIAISAGRDLNTDVKGRGAPMLLRVFELKSDAAFQEAGFFALQDNAKAVLGPDLLAVDQFIVRPGETREIRRRAHPETVAIGVFAGYRDLPHAVWRVVHKLPPAPDAGWYRAVMPSHKVGLKIELQGNAILVIDEEAEKHPTRFANESVKGLDPETVDAAPPQAEAPVRLPDAPPRGMPRGAESPRGGGLPPLSGKGIGKGFPSPP